MLVNCVVYNDGHKVADSTLEDIPQHLQQAGNFVWVALQDATEPELRILQKQFNLHELAVEDVFNGLQRPKVEEYDEHLFVILQAPAYHGKDLHMGQINIFVGNNFVLSVRQECEQTLLGVRARAEREPHLLKYGSAYVLYALSDAIVDLFFPVVDMLDDELEQLETVMFHNQEARQNMERLYDFKYKSNVLRHALLPLADGFSKLFGGRVPAQIDGAENYFRDVHDHIMLLNSQLDTIRDTISTAIQVNLSLIAIDHGEVNKKLAGWGAILVLITIFTGIWGMNFEYMPELHWKFGYPMALTVMAGSSYYLYRRFKKAGWI